MYEAENITGTCVSAINNCTVQSMLFINMILFSNWQT